VGPAAQWRWRLGERVAARLGKGRGWVACLRLGCADVTRELGRGGARGRLGRAGLGWLLGAVAEVGQGWGKGKNGSSQLRPKGGGWCGFPFFISFLYPLVFKLEHNSQFSMNAQQNHSSNKILM
jgi:hypothetical protein